MKIIGILGGMGPRATVEFEQLLLSKLSGSDQQLPAIITINDGSIPDRSNFLLGKGIDPLPRMSRNALQLQALGAELICVPCNTACAPAIFDRLQARLKIPVLNLPEIVIEAAKAQQMKSLFILATDGTVKAKVFQSLCQANNIGCTIPSSSFQEMVQAVIDSVKAGNMPRARILTKKLIRPVKISGCQAVILGCTELPLVKTVLEAEGLTCLDSQEILADETVRCTLTSKIKAKV